MSQPTRKKIDKEDAAPKIGEMKVDRPKLRGIPNPLRSHLFGDCEGEGIVAE
jgi:hypothetical protein